MKPRALLTGLAVCIALIPATDLHAQRSYVGGRSAGDQGAPFSQAVWIDDTLDLSGMLGLAQGGVPDTPEEEARNVLNAIQRVLDGEGLTMDHLVSVQIFCSDVSHYGAFNEVYRTYFTEQYPARAFIGAGNLLFDARFEVQAIASRK
jgi:2-iminobutanoate/2-iminopropanoate deaminase